MAAVYNEFDPHKAEWLRALIAAGLIAPGEVDTRSIEDVHPDDYRGFTQVHLFAGVGGWSYAARRAGWDDSTPFWSCSCPCQPFSAAGKGDGFADERHLWPAVFHLKCALRPKRVVGEQVASRDGRDWLDLVHSDVDAAEYAFRVLNLSSPIVGAPNIRQRLYWVADAHDTLRWPDGARGYEQHGAHTGWPQGASDAQGRGEAERMADACGARGRRDTGSVPRAQEASGCERPFDGREHDEPVAHDTICRLASANRVESKRTARGRPGPGEAPGAGAHGGLEGPSALGAWAPRGAGATAGFWGDADWILCADPDGPRWRPVEPWTFPLAAGLPRSFRALPPELRGLAEMAGLDAASLARAKSYRTGALKGWGDAINAEVATAFLRAL